MQRSPSRRCGSSHGAAVIVGCCCRCPTALRPEGSTRVTSSHHRPVRHPPRLPRSSCAPAARRRPPSASAERRAESPSPAATPPRPRPCRSRPPFTVTKTESTGRHRRHRRRGGQGRPGRRSRLRHRSTVSDGKALDSTLRQTGAVGLDLGADAAVRSFKSLVGKKVGPRCSSPSPPADAFGATGNESSASRRTTRSSSCSTSSRPPRRSTERDRQGRGAEGGPADRHDERGQAGRPSPSPRRQGPDQDRRPAADPGHRRRRSRRARPCGGLHRRAPEGRQRLRLQRQPPRAAGYFDFPIGVGPGHQGLGQRPGRPEDRQPRAARHPAGRGLRHRGQPAGKINGTDTLVFVVDILAAY